MDPSYLSSLLSKYPELGTTCPGPQLDILAFIIRSERATIADNHYVPFDFLGLDNSGDGFMAAYFNWRWYKRNGEDYRCVTVEFGRDRQVLSLGPPRLRPRDLYSNDQDFHTELGNVTFNWRWFQRGEDKYRLVTLESIGAVEGLNFPVSNQVLPRHLKGLPGDNQEWNELRFNWRWYNRGEGERFRVLTLE